MIVDQAREMTKVPVRDGASVPFARADCYPDQRRWTFPDARGGHASGPASGFAALPLLLLGPERPEVRR